MSFADLCLLKVNKSFQVDIFLEVWFKALMYAYNIMYITYCHIW